ncbi:MAG: hypothetical protein HYW89_03570 [Candidatus Sungiibacteriota bacterium]|uniref:Antitoxin n=1 Tax=Candidatus Sungiibacteriota bacterium TaxID=2750080 RepID=A0A7T5RJ40_9BACT|nr:MAG: hypothetical protein HYW89_03570 [Candidatus Sungbacteria bacterium]
MNTITIPTKKIKKEGGIVVLSLEEYRKLSERAVPTYYLKGKAAKKFDRMVEAGLKEYREGKTISARSLGEAMKIYAKKNKRS